MNVKYFLDNENYKSRGNGTIQFKKTCLLAGRPITTWMGNTTVW